MMEIRIHGRGGQGVVTAAELLSMAAFFDGKYAQAFPSFGSERMGAPVTAFCRISQALIRSREPVSHPDVVMIQDATLFHHVDVFKGLSQKGFILINSTRSLEDLGVLPFCATLPEGHYCTISATEVALKYLGRSLPNAGLVAGLGALTGCVTKQAVDKAIQQKFPGRLGELNCMVAADLFTQVSALTGLNARVMT